MSTVESLKKQASRLAEYLGANHRVRLKHTSALEALAAVHGARNWHTLAAQAEREAANVSTAATGGPPMPLTWWPDGTVHVEVPPAEWHRHALAFGEERPAQLWVERQAFEAVSAGMGALLFLFDSVLSVSALAHDTVVFDLRQPGAVQVAGPGIGAAGVNLGKGLDSAQVAQLWSLLTSSSRGAASSDADYRVLQSREASAPGLAELLAQPHPLVVLMPDQQPRRWGRFWMQLAAASLVEQGERFRPWVLGLPQLEVFQGPALMALARQGRAIGCALRVAQVGVTQSREAADTVHELKLNAWHQVDLRPSRGYLSSQLLERLQQAPAICLSGGQYRL